MPDDDVPGPGDHPAHPAAVVLGCVAIVVIMVGVIVAAARLAGSSPDQAVATASVAAGPFYDSPVRLPPGPPGTIIATQPITSPPPGTQGWRILYKSTAFDTNQPIAVSGVVFAPAGPAAGEPRPVVAWEHETTGVASVCAPSIPENGGANSIPGLDSFIQLGYVVVATDYPGLGTAGPHPYLVGSSEARATLDSVRAAHNLTGTGAGTSFVAWGHSQGGQAALFAAQAAPIYAPDLTLVGVAAVAPATDLASLLQLHDGSVAGNALTSLAAVSWSQVYPNAPLDSLLTPAAIPLARGVADHCLSDRLSDVPLVAGEQLTFTVADPATVEPWATLARDNSVGPTPIRAPIYVAQGDDDDIVPPPVTQQFLTGRCRAGEPVQYQGMIGVGHAAAGFAAAPAAVLWIHDRFDGVPMTNGCPAVPH
jgi:alpha-beta hydrolase superfamily lysophospholipase